MGSSPDFKSRSVNHIKKKYKFFKVFQKKNLNRFMFSNILIIILS